MPFQKGHPPYLKHHTPEAKEKIGAAKRGKPLSPEHIQKLRDSHKGYVMPPEEREKRSRTLKGRVIHPQSAETREKISRSYTGWNDGPKSHRWKGGKTAENALRRSRCAYGTWRTAVFERDDYTCQRCGLRGVELNAHHIDQVALYPERIYAVDNGRTLCIACHKAVHRTAAAGGCQL